MKDADGCDKPRGAVIEHYIRGFPNGETRSGKTWAPLAEHIGQRRERGELKHLSTPRKRDHLLSSGERKGTSPNPLHVIGCSRCVMGVVRHDGGLCRDLEELQICILVELFWKDRAKKVIPL